MATWFTITFEGEPTEADFARVAELAAEGCTSGQLLNSTPRYIARFTPEAWIRDQAVEVDAPGPQEWDCTAYALEHLDYLATRAHCAFCPDISGPEGVLDNDDVFAGDPAAPGWIAAWQGPFTIRIRTEEG